MAGVLPIEVVALAEQLVLPPRLTPSSHVMDNWVEYVARKLPIDDLRRLMRPPAKLKLEIHGVSYRGFALLSRKEGWIPGLPFPQKEARAKTFNRRRPELYRITRTGAAQEKEEALILVTAPGRDYILHYATMITSCLPDAQDQVRAFYYPRIFNVWCDTLPKCIRSGDTVVLGYVEDIFTDLKELQNLACLHESWEFDSPSAAERQFGWVVFESRSGGNQGRVVLLGVVDTYWGSLSKKLIEKVLEQKPESILYVSKVGTLVPSLLDVVHVPRAYYVLRRGKVCRVNLQNTLENVSARYTGPHISVATMAEETTMLTKKLEEEFGGASIDNEAGFMAEVISIRNQRFPWHEAVRFGSCHFATDYVRREKDANMETQHNLAVRNEERRLICLAKIWRDVLRPLFVNFRGQPPEQVFFITPNNDPHSAPGDLHKYMALWVRLGRLDLVKEHEGFITARTGKSLHDMRTTCHDYTMLHLAIRHESIEVARWILDQGKMRLSAGRFQEFIDARSVAGSTALHLACQLKHPVSILLLRSFNASDDIQNASGSLPTEEQYASSTIKPRPTTTRSAGYLSADHRWFGPFQVTIWWACRVNWIALVQSFVALRGTSIIQVENSLGETPLLIAAAYGHDRLLLYLLKLGANAEHKDIFGNTALHLACRYAHNAYNVVIHLRQAGCSVDEKNYMQRTPLDYLHEVGHADASSARGILRRLLFPVDTGDNGSMGYLQLLQQLVWGTPRRPTRLYFLGNTALAFADVRNKEPFWVLIQRIREALHDSRLPVRFLLADPHGAFVRQRAMDVCARYGQAERENRARGVLQQWLFTVVLFARALQHIKALFALRFTRENLRYSICIGDDSALIAPYLHTQHLEEGKPILVTRQCDGASAFDPHVSFFEIMWDSSLPFADSEVSNFLQPGSFPDETKLLKSIRAFVAPSVWPKL